MPDEKGNRALLSFAAPTMPIFPVKNSAYARDAEWGTLFKMYEYAIRAATNMMLEGGLMGRVRILLPEPALPIHFHECRDYAGHSGSYNTPMGGLIYTLEEDRKNPFKPHAVEAVEKDWEGVRFPTKFHFKDRDPGKSLQRDAHLNSQTRISFVTDAENDYFKRDEQPGTMTLYQIVGAELVPAKNWRSPTLFEGNVTLSLALPAEAEVGDIVVYEAHITDHSRMEPFVNRFSLSVKAEREAPTPNPKPPTPKPDKPGAETGKDAQQDTKLNVPNPSPSGMRPRHGRSEKSVSPEPRTPYRRARFRLGNFAPSVYSAAGPSAAAPGKCAKSSLARAAVASFLCSPKEIDAFVRRVPCSTRTTIRALSMAAAFSRPPNDGAEAAHFPTRVAQTSWPSSP